MKTSSSLKVGDLVAWYGTQSQRWFHGHIRHFTGIGRTRRASVAFIEQIDTADLFVSHLWRAVWTWHGPFAMRPK